MIIKFNKRGATPKKAQDLLRTMNEWLQQNPEHQYKFDKKYTTIEELEEGWKQMQEIGVEEATVESTSREEFSRPDTSSAEDYSNSFSNEDSFDFGDFDPNAEDTIEREYNKVEYDYSMTEDIPEAQFGTKEEQARVMQEEQNFSQPSMDDQPSIHRTEAPNQNSFTNPQLSEADDKTKRIAAEQMVDMILGFYEKAHEIAKPMVKIKDKKIGELEAKGLINPNDKLPLDREGNSASLRELAKETNEAIDDTLAYDPTFNARVRPPMIREFAKRGWGMTDMQYILVAFTQDVAMKGAMIMGVKKQFNDITKLFKEIEAERKSANEGTPVTKATVDSVQKTYEAQEDVIDDETAFTAHTEAEEVV